MQINLTEQELSDIQDAIHEKMLAMVKERSAITEQNRNRQELSNLISRLSYAEKKLQESWHTITRAGV